MCDDGISDSFAEVVCRQLGLSLHSKAITIMVVPVYMGYSASHLISPQISLTFCDIKGAQ